MAEKKFIDKTQPINGLTQIVIANDNLVDLLDRFDNMKEQLTRLAAGKKIGIWLTEREVSTQYEVSVKTIRNWRKNGSLLFSSPPGKKGFLYRRDDVDDFIEKHRKQ